MFAPEHKLELCQAASVWPQLCITFFHTKLKRAGTLERKVGSVCNCLDEEAVKYSCQKLALISAYMNSNVDASCEISDQLYMAGCCSDLRLLLPCLCLS